MVDGINRKQVLGVNSFRTEKAKTLHNSRGWSTGRIHLLGYEGKGGKDRYAVAAEKMPKDAAVELGCWDKRYNVLVLRTAPNGDPTWFKINKQSFIKRFNPTEDLEIDETTGVCTNFDKLVNERAESLEKLKAKSNASTPFEKEFLHQMSVNNIGNSYKEIVFIPMKDPYKELINQNIEKGPILFVTYSEKEIYLGEFNAKYGEWKEKVEKFIGFYPVSVNINSSQYKKIILGKPLTQTVVDTIKDEALQLPEGEIWVGLNARARDFQLHFKFNRDTKISEFQQLIDEIKIEFFLGGTSYSSGHPNEDCKSEDTTLISLLTKNEDNELVRSWTKYQDQVLSPSFVLDQLKMLQQKPSQS